MSNKSQKQSAKRKTKRQAKQQQARQELKPKPLAKSDELRNQSVSFMPEIMEVNDDPFQPTVEQIEAYVALNPFDETSTFTHADTFKAGYNLLLSNGVRESVEYIHINEATCEELDAESAYMITFDSKIKVLKDNRILCSLQQLLLSRCREFIKATRGTPKVFSLESLQILKTSLESAYPSGFKH